MEPHFFTSPAAFRHWLEKHHEQDQELLVGYYKKGSGKPSMTWPESVDEALCFGWIDGVRRSRDDESYTIRFTPRKPNSTWSAVNINKMQALIAKGLVAPAGLAAYKKRTEDNSRIYSHEQAAVALNAELQAKFEADAEAWEFFSKQAPSYRRSAIHLVMSAKQEKTRQARLEKLLKACGQGQRI